jgi:deoxyribodipyrimidine photo-lyase
LTSVAREAGASGVAWSAAYDARTLALDQQLQADLEEAGYEAAVVHDAPAIPPEETAAARASTGDGYRAFAPFFAVWRELPIVSHENPLLLQFAMSDLSGEPLPEPDEFAAHGVAAKAGAAVARDAFARFLRDDAAHYAEAMLDPADDATSHMSPHLSFGTISARGMAVTVRERLHDAQRPAHERLSLRMLLRAIARRDFFLQLSWFHPGSERESLQEKMRGFTFDRTHSALRAWCEGRTGFPLVDAGMRQLRATGAMHPHVRSVVASFLCFDLGVDWRVGRDEWDRLLVEDDPALATGNWQWIAGVGADMAQYPRIYNPERRRRRVDPGGRYVRQWVPELERIPVTNWSDRFTHSRQLAFDLSEPDGYPRPVVEHERAAHDFLRRYRDFMDSD